MRVNHNLASNFAWIITTILLTILLGILVFFGGTELYAVITNNRMGLDDFNKNRSVYEAISECRINSGNCQGFEEGILGLSSEKVVREQYCGYAFDKQSASNPKYMTYVQIQKGHGFTTEKSYLHILSEKEDATDITLFASMTVGETVEFKKFSDNAYVTKLNDHWILCSQKGGRFSE